MKAWGKLFLIVTILIFLGSGGYLLYDYLAEEKDQDDIARLRRMVEQSDAYEGEAASPAPGTARDMDGLTALVSRFLTESEAFENQSIQTVRLEVDKLDPAEAPLEVKVFIDGQALFSPSKQSQVNRLIDQVTAYMSENPGWTEPGREIIDMDMNLEAAPILGKYQSLYEENRDMVGWIKIEGTQIDYPVMQTKEDPEFYLRTNFDKEYAYGGMIFMDARCDPTDRFSNQLIYGHNMKSGSMFGQLPNYEGRAFWAAHKTFRVDMLNQAREYEVMAMFRSRQYREGEEGFQYYNYIDLSQWNAFHSFVTQAKQASMIDTGVTAQFGDELVTLSTCSYHVNDGTFVVVGRRIA